MKQTICLNCGKRYGLHQFQTGNCPKGDSDHPGEFLDTLFIDARQAAPVLPRIIAALGWQGGTVDQVVAEVSRLKAFESDPMRGLEINKTLADWWPIGRPVNLADMEDLEAKLRDLFHLPAKPLGQGVAALLPEHEANG